MGGREWKDQGKKKAKMEREKLRLKCRGAQESCTEKQECRGLNEQSTNLTRKKKKENSGETQKKKNDAQGVELESK